MTFLKHFFIYQNQKTFFHICILQLFQYASSNILWTVANSGTVFSFTVFFPKSRFSGDQIVHDH